MGRIAGSIELQGHRGARGVLPENSMPSVKAALAAGVNAVELDVAMSLDGALVVTHDEALNPDIVRFDGRWIREPILVRSLTAEQLRCYDVGQLRPGSDYARRFPQQCSADNVYMPQLQEVMALPEVRATPGISLDIEIKTSPLNQAATFSPDAIAKALAETIAHAGMRRSCRVRSFDWRALKAVRAVEPDLPLACLTAEQQWLDNISTTAFGSSPWLAGFDVGCYDGSVARTVHAFGAEVWAPYYRDLKQNELDLAHSLGLRVFVWTVNDEAEMRELLHMGVDGLTTDYPEIGRHVIDTMMNDE